MERGVALARSGSVGVEELPPRVRNHQSKAFVVAGDNPAEMSPLEGMERRYVAKVLSACRGNKSFAAKVLGVGRKTLCRYLEEGRAEKGPASGTARGK